MLRQGGSTADIRKNRTNHHRQSMATGSSRNDDTRLFANRRIVSFLDFVSKGNTSYDLHNTAVYDPRKPHADAVVPLVLAQIHTQHHSQAPALLGGDVEIELGGSVHPVRMLPVSGKDVRNLRFGLVYGPKRKRVRFRAPDLITYDNWEMILEVAVEKAATERPTFPVWPGQGPSPGLSADDGYASEEFGFSDYDDDLVGFNETKVADFRYNVEGKYRADGQHNPLTGSFVDFIDPASPDSEDEADHSRQNSVESEYEAALNSFKQVVQTKKDMARLQVDNSEVVNSSTKDVPNQDVTQKLKIDSSRFARLQPQLSSSHSAQTAKDMVRGYVTWLRGATRRINRREELQIIKRTE